MNKPIVRNHIATNIYWSLCGNIIYAVCQWGMLVVLAKFGSVASVGEFSLGLAITAPIVLFFNLQLRNVVATDSTFEYLFADYFKIRLFSSLLALAGIIIILLFLPYAGPLKRIILIIGLVKIIESISDICFGLLQQYERLDYVAKSMSIKGLLAVGSVYTGIVLADSLNVALVLVGLSWLAVLLFYDLTIVRKLTSIRFSSFRLIDFRPVKKIVWLALPLGFVEMLASTNMNMPRYFVENFNGVEMLGIYSGMAYFIIAGVTVVYACGQSFLPRMAILFAENDTAGFKNLFLKMEAVVLIAGVGGVVGAYLFGGPILEIFYNKEFKGYGDVFVVIMFSAAMSYLATSTWFALTSMRCFRAQVVLFGVALVCNIILCVSLIPLYGLKGAAIAFAVAETVRFCIGLVLVAGQFRARGGTPVGIVS